MGVDGNTLAVIGIEIVELHPKEFVTINDTVKFPAVVYEWTGFVKVEVTPSPKFQLKLLPPPIDKSVNCAGLLTQIAPTEKFASGFG
jgi:hypothetical protein